MGLQFETPLVVSCHDNQAQTLLHPTPHKHTPPASALSLAPCSESLYLNLHTACSLMSYQKSLQSQPSPPPFAPSTKKRSPQIAFADETPPSSRPPSRAHTQKRLRAKRAAERPTWVSTKDESIELDARLETVLVDVLWPGAEGLDQGRRLGDLRRARAFTVLCFLGSTIEHLHGLSQVATLLGNLNADVFGVSLSAPPLHSSSLPIIHDHTRSLTLSLGLLHPLGGGRMALDAIVVLDKGLRRRMVLPVGWGPRQPSIVDEEGSGVNSVIGRCVKGVEWLCNEAVDEVVEDVEMGMGESDGLVMASL